MSILRLALSLIWILDFAVAKQPNIVFIMSDDQDARLGSLNFMPTLQRQILREGLSVQNHFGTVALCCPARVTLLRGQAAHNTNMTDVGGPGGGYPKFMRTGEMKSYLPVWLRDAGYRTAYFGKFMNALNARSPPPLGWDWTDILVAPFIYAFNNVVMSRNGEEAVHYKGWHQTDVLRIKSVDLLERFIDDPDKRPFFLEIAPASPHVLTPGGRPTIPLQRHMDLFPGIVAPRTPNWNTLDDDLQRGKPSWLKTLPVMNESVIEASDLAFRKRLQGLQGVDEIVEDVVNMLEEKGVLNNTFIIYTTDNGFHLGQHRVPGGKGLPYVEDVNLPFAVRGPGIPAGKISNIPSTHVDIAPTLLDIAGVTKEDWPVFFDGRSLLPEWKDPDAYSAFGAGGDGIEREIINVEYWGTATAPGGKFTQRYGQNSYKSLRIVAQNGRQGWLFNRWCSRNQTELYDTVADPWEMRNLANGNVNAGTQRLIDRLSGLLLVTKSCGQESCRKPWEVLSDAFQNGDFSSNGTARIDPKPELQIGIAASAFNTLDQAMDSSYDDFFAALPSFGFQTCMRYQFTPNEGPYFPPESEDLGGKFRDESVDESAFYINDGSFSVETSEMYGSWEQRSMGIEDVEASMRKLTDEEIGWPTVRCEAPDYCNEIDDD